MFYATHSPLVLIEDLRRVLAEVKLLGVDVVGRFHEYLHVLEEFSRLPFPRKEPWGKAAALTWEANSQCQQLVTSSRIWSSVNQDALRVALVKALRGELLPPEDNDDQARNTLLELTTAALLHARKVGVDLTLGDEDVVAKVAGLPDFAIECKRPASWKGILRNLRDVKSQLETRYGKERPHGIAVFGIDRSLPLMEDGSVATDSGFVARDAQHIQTVVHRRLIPLRNELRRAMADPATPDLALFPRTPLFGLVLVGSVFNLQEGVPVGVQQLSLSCSGPEDHEVSQRLISTFGKLLGEIRV